MEIRTAHAKTLCVLRVCTCCPAGTFNDAPTKSNVDGTCKCNANFKVKNNACVPCELTSTRVGGSVMGGLDTYCKCGRNEKVINNECVVYEAGSSFLKEMHLEIIINVYVTLDIKNLAQAYVKYVLLVPIRSHHTEQMRLVCVNQTIT